MGPNDLLPALVLFLPCARHVRRLVPLGASVNLTLALLIGFFLGAICALAVVSWQLRDDGPFLLLERWWLENDDRWEWLRQYESKER